MPLALDTEQTFDLVLESDQKKPADKRPTFTFRFLSNREWKQIAKLADNIQDLQKRGLEPLLTEVENGLRISLVGWRHMTDPKTGKPIPYKPENLDMIINPAEMWELVFKVRNHVSLDITDKKKSVSRSRSSMGKSAKSVSRRKHARTDQAN